jgi:hypothetical protein
MTADELAGVVERSRREQRYPPHVEDPSVLAAMADGDRVERGDGDRAA